MAAKATIKHFDSFAALMAKAAESNFSYDDMPDWTGGIDEKETRRRAIEGDLSMVAQANEIASKLHVGIGESPNRWQTESSVTGSRVCVPDYLTGSPTCMRRRVKRSGDARAVKVYVNLCASSGIDAKDMLKRGVAILGLIDALQSQNIYVELYATCDGTVYGHEVYNLCTRVETTPLDLATTGFCLAHPAFFRIIGHKALFASLKKPEYGGWSRITDRGAREAYNMAPEDIYIPFANWGDPLIKNPEKWLNDRISQLVGSGVNETSW